MIESPRDIAAYLLGYAEDVDRVRDGALDPDDVAGLIESVVAEDAGTDPARQHELLWLVDGELARSRRLIDQLRKAITRLRTRDIVAHGDIRLADEAWYTSRAGGWKIIDRDRLIDWLDTAEDIAAAFRLDDGNLRKTALEAIAERRFRADPDAELLTDEQITIFVNAVLDTFLEWVPTGDDGERKLQSIPAKDRKWAQALGHTERRPR